MTRDTRPIVVEQTYPVDRATVWGAITDPAQMTRWYFEPIPDFRPEVGFETQFTVHALGKDWVHQWRVTEVVPEERLAYTFHYAGYSGDACVLWELSDVPGGTRLRLTHTGLDTYPDDEPAFQRESGVAGWTYFLQEALRAFLEGQALQQCIRTWDKDYLSASELLAQVRAAVPDASDDALVAAVESVARGEYCPASACAAATLCELRGLGDPLETAERHLRQSGAELSDPLWFLWIAGYTYNWVCNGGLSACYLEFDVRQYADRIRVYEAIGAERAAEAMREADRVFGETGPPPAQEDRSAWWTEEVAQALNEPARRFWACGDEIFTQAFLYALEHPEYFRQRQQDG